MNDIKYPKTELFVVLGTKTYPLYTTVDPQTVHELLTQTEGREKFLSFEVAIKKNHGNGLWYPGCDDVANKLANIPCGGKVTSCPDQLSKAINENLK